MASTKFSRVFKSKIAYASLDATTVEYDFVEAPGTDEETVLAMVCDLAATVGIEADQVTVRRDEDGKRAFVVAVLVLSDVQYLQVMDVVSGVGWAKAAFFDRGMRINGSRIIRQQMTAYAINEKAQRIVPQWQPDKAPRLFRRGKGFNRQGRHYELSDDGQTWVDTGASPCCG